MSANLNVPSFPGQAARQQEPVERGTEAPRRLPCHRRGRLA